MASTDDINRLLDHAIDDIGEAQALIDTGTPPTPPAEGVDFVVTKFQPPPLTVGQPANLAATVRNRGTADHPPGTAVIGVGFLLDGAEAGNQVTWVSTDAGLAAGAEVELRTDAPGMTGGAWVPEAAGDHTLTAFVDDLNRIVEYDESAESNQATALVIIGEAPPAPEPGARPFATDSLWNTHKTAQAFADGADGFLRGASWVLNNGAYAHPIAYATNADPINTIDTPNSWGWPAQRLSLHLPDGTVSASGSDGHLSYLNFEARVGADFWILRPTGTRAWRCEAYAMFDPLGPGFGQASPFQSAGVTACGAPTVAGTITKAEVEAGRIDHALCAALDKNNQGGVGTCNTAMLWPAINSDVWGGGGPLAEAALLLVVGAEPAGLNAAEKAVFRAASTYGVYVVDKLDGQPALYGDTSGTVGNAIRGDKLTAIMHQARMVKTW